MSVNRNVLTLLAAIVLGACGFAASAQDKPKVVATFSILADLANNVGGDRVEVATLVGPDGDAHVYSPTPADGRRLAEAKLVDRKRAQVRRLDEPAHQVLRHQGPRRRGGEGRGADQGRGARHGHDHGHADVDPHAWQSVANAKRYVTNIRDGLIAADPAGKAAYEANAAAYLERARRARSGREGGRRSDPEGPATDHHLA